MYNLRLKSVLISCRLERHNSLELHESFRFFSFRYGINYLAFFRKKKIALCAIHRKEDIINAEMLLATVSEIAISHTAKEVFFCGTQHFAKVL